MQKKFFMNKIKIQINETIKNEKYLNDDKKKQYNFEKEDEEEEKDFLNLFDTLNFACKMNEQS